MPLSTRHAPATHLLIRSLSPLDLIPMDLDDPHPHGNPVFDHLSMPFFPTLFSSPSDPSAAHHPSGLELDDYHFGYDEQLAAESRESGSDSSGDLPPSTAASTSSMDVTVEHGAIGAEYDGLLAPRRSVRERRLPPQLLASVPLDLRTYRISSLHRQLHSKD